MQRDSDEMEQTTIPKSLCKPEDLHIQLVGKIELEEPPQYHPYNLV